jgi:hypothetical protein
MSDFHRLAGAYISKGDSHKRFLRRLALLKVFVFSAIENSKKSLQDIQDNFTSNEQAASLAMVTHPICKTKFQSIVLRRDEFEIIASDADKLKSQMFQSTYCDIWRVFEDYRIDLFCEIIDLSGGPEPDRWKLSFHEHLENAYKDIRLALYPNQMDDFNLRRIRYFVALARFTRNAIEHRDGLVDSKSLSKWIDQPFSSPPFNVGDHVDAGPMEVGELISFVETLAEDMDKRAIKAFPNLLT